MNFAAVYSVKDEAGRNIAERLKELSDMRIMSVERDIVDAEHVDNKISEDFIVFISKHQSQKHNKTLSLHAPGNWKKAELGGEIEKVCLTSGFFMKRMFIELSLQKNKAGLEYEVTLECTHHGPLIEKPCCFIEIGSTIEEWKDKKAGEVIARTIVETIRNLNYDSNWIPSVGIGGPHYCFSFNKVQLNSKYAISHIIPEYCLPLTKEMIGEALKKTKEDVKIVVLDWKGLGNSDARNNVVEMLKEMKIEAIRTGNVEK